MVKIVGKIENFDKNKSYSGFNQPLTKIVPVYGYYEESGEELYGWIGYQEIPLSDPRTEIHLSWNESIGKW